MLHIQYPILVPILYLQIGGCPNCSCISHVVSLEEAKGFSFQKNTERDLFFHTQCRVGNLKPHVYTCEMGYCISLKHMYTCEVLRSTKMERHPKGSKGGMREFNVRTHQDVEEEILLLLSSLRLARTIRPC
jgi:hypothetical protein